MVLISRSLLLRSLSVASKEIDLTWCAGGCRYVKFDTFHPAVDMGLPVTRVISRVTLQRKLAEKAEELEGKGVLCNDCHVVDYEEARFWSPGAQHSQLSYATALLNDSVWDSLIGQSSKRAMH